MTPALPIDPDPAPFAAQAEAVLPWRDPLAVAAGLRDAPGAVALLSDGAAGRSHVAAEPDAVWEGGEGFASLARPGWRQGVVGLAAYDGGARGATGPRPPAGDGWPDLSLARYPARLRFDHAEQRLTAVGRGVDTASAQAALGRAVAFAEAAAAAATPAPPASAFVAESSDESYRAAVLDVVARIGSGELFQANIARAWSGALNAGGDPFDVMLRLQAGRASAFGACWRLGGRALVSNSPELFLTHDAATGRIETRPIKGTRPRGADPISDAREAETLRLSAKDRAENLMIVDLMRNDLARVARPGSVRVERLFEIESLPTVHHLVSTVTGRAAPGVDAADLLAAAFPPGSITGAPKHQAIKVIAAHEPPRGAWCGALFHIDDRRRLTASVLIRTASFWMSQGLWRFRALAGAGITADSDPEAERLEVDAKIRALREALSGA
ncbi:MAG: anthranilate synthase component I family protein [Brevundimonas sp.]|nr:MAG: anthranilate synthase component I family protein [Brevundimonas sp.]